jgi:DNA-binding beta-propeller fold protein YncE
MRCTALAVLTALACSVLAMPGQAADAVPLRLEAKIALGAVSGRIDHLAIDLARRRLFVAELGNDTVGVVDLTAGTVVHRITGLNEPQGVGYLPSSDVLYVANARDGSVPIYQGADLVPSGLIKLGSDADNIRIDAAANRVFIGHGDGALAIIDPASQTKIADIALKAHPESFQLEANGNRIFVNLPDARQIAVVDRAAGKVTAAIATKESRANFPMAIDAARGNLLVVFRSPAKLMAFSLADFAPQARIESCADADDVFVDQKRDRIYVSCGEGFIDVVEPRQGGYVRVAQVPTASGARTALFVPELDRLFLAVRAGAEPAAIWVFAPP